MEKIALITGGSGYLGSHLAKTLKRRGWKVIIFDIKQPRHKYFDFYYPGDIRDRLAVNKIVSRHHYHVVIHCAGRIEVGGSMDNPTEFIEVNVGGTAILLNAMKCAMLDTILFSSTAAVYAGGHGRTISEDDPTTHNNSVYGSTKLICEQLIKDSGLKYGIFRYFNLAGADPECDIGENHDPETHLIPCILGNLNNVEIFGDDYPTEDGTCVRDYVHVCDVADAHLLAIEHLNENESFIVNLGTGIGYSVLQIIKLIGYRFGVKVNYKIHGRRPGDPDRLVANVSLAKRLLKYEPKHGMLSILKTAKKWKDRNEG